MAGFPSPRPGEERQRRLVEGVDGASLEIARQASDDLAAPVVHEIVLRIALAGEAAEHVRPGIADEDDELHAGRHQVILVRREPAESREAFTPDRIEYGVVHDVQLKPWVIFGNLMLAACCLP